MKCSPSRFQASRVVLVASLPLLSFECAPQTSSSQSEALWGPVDTMDDAVGLAYMLGGICTGTLITPTIVLTAAHCLPTGGRSWNPDDSGPGGVGFYTGVGTPLAQDMAPQEMTWHRVAEVAHHPDWAPVYGTTGNGVIGGGETAIAPNSGPDLALLRLAEPILDTAPVPLGNAPPSIGQVCKGVGYGRSDMSKTRGERRSGPLQVLTLTPDRNSDTLLAQGRHSIGIDHGDSGGPLFCGDVLSGVVSTNDGSLYDWTDPTVMKNPNEEPMTYYARVDLDGSLSWITEKVNAWGGFGDLTPRAPNLPPEREPMLKSVRSVSGANEFSWHLSACAIATDGTLWCWGADINCTLGDCEPGNRDYERADQLRPVQIGSDSDWVRVSGSCAQKPDGTLWCWGERRYGISGIRRTPEAVVSDVLVSSDPLASTFSGRYYIKKDGSLWGSSQQGSDTDWSSVVESPINGGVASALKTNGSLWRVNGTRLTQVGDGNWKQAGGVCGIKDNGSLYCWEHNEDPAPVGNDTDWMFVSRTSACAIKTNNTLWCTLHGSGPSDFNFVQVGTDTDWATVESSCGTKVDGSLYCWGNNRRGQVGDGTYTYRPEPVRISAE